MAEIQSSQATEKRTRAKWYAITPEEIFKELNVTVETGLSTAEVTQHQQRYGKNELPAGEGINLLAMILDQFKDVTVIVLIIAAIISIFIGEAADSIVILVIVALNAVIGVYQEWQAENALAALGKMQTPIIRARRDGHVSEMSALELVPGDIVLLEAGDSIPADGRLIQASNVKVDESAMTGESVPVDKDARTMEDSDPPPPLADRHNLVFMGTSINYGRAEMVITETGINTQLGHIAAMLQSVEAGRTPLQERLEKMGFTLASAALTVCAIVFVAGVLRGEDIQEMFLTAVSLAVAAIPEGLPAIITVSLALGANRMVRRNALIRKLPAVETLGSVTTICSDKTGTLTRNEMMATTIVLPGPGINDVMVGGVGYEPSGEFTTTGGKRESMHVLKSPQLARFLQSAALCTDAFLERENGNGGWHIVGDTTEGALIVMARKQGFIRDVLEKDLPRVQEIPFTSERKAMATIHEPIPGTPFFSEARYVAIIKGAPDQLISWSAREAMPNENKALTDERRDKWQWKISQLANNGMRVMGLAYRPFDKLPEELTPENVERDLIFLGLVGIVDPPRRSAIKAVHVAHQAGIRTVMITGDHKLTGAAIARQVGILSADGNNYDDGILIGTELDCLSPEQLLEKVKTVSVFARVSPEHKLRVVEALQKNGEIAAMTGDGVNDAPALKQANIGVAMGVTGTDVSKGAADMVLTDDNFASIVAAVEEGRAIYDNIRKFLKYLLGSNSGEIMTMFGSILIGLKLPLIAIQILWINLVTDGLPAIALGFEPGEPDVMNRKPRPPRESIFAHGVGWHIMWVGLWLAIMTLGGYIWVLSGHGDIFDPAEDALHEARTMAFFILATAQLFHVSAIHAGNASALEAPITKNRLLFGVVIFTILLQTAAVYAPFMHDLLKTTSLDLIHFIGGFLIAASIFPAVEVEKWYRRNNGDMS